MSLILILVVPFLQEERTFLKSAINAHTDCLIKLLKSGPFGQAANITRIINYVNCLLLINVKLLALAIITIELYREHIITFIEQ